MLYDPERRGDPYTTRLSLAVLLGLLALTVMLRGALMAETREQVHAPEFPQGMQWLNTAAPLRLADLRGTDGTQLYVADSETSSIRVISLGLDGRLQTIVGEGLFEFGDQDGMGKTAVRLQHPLGVAYHDGIVYIADTYNHKIKKLYPTMASATTSLGSGKPGHSDGKAATFYEPGGLSIAAAQLYIADTNNHAMRVADLATGEVATLALRGLPLPGTIAGFSGTSLGTERVITVAVQQVKAGTTGRLTIDLRFPDGYHLNAQAPLSYQVQVNGTGIDIAEPDRQFNAIAPPLPLAVPFQALEGAHQATVDIAMTFYYCREDNTGVCVIQSVRWLVPLHTVPGGIAAEPVISYQAEAPVLQKQL